MSFSPIPIETQFLNVFFDYINLQIKQAIFYKTLHLPEFFHVKEFKNNKSRHRKISGFHAVALFHHLEKIGMRYQIERAKHISKELMSWDNLERWIELLSSPFHRKKIFSSLTTRALNCTTLEIHETLSKNPENTELINILSQLPQEKMNFILNLVHKYLDNPLELSEINDSDLLNLEHEFHYYIHEIREQLEDFEQQIPQIFNHIQQLKKYIHLLELSNSPHVSHILIILQSENLQTLIKLHHSENTQAFSSAVAPSASQEDDAFEQFVHIEESETELFQLHLQTTFFSSYFKGSFEELVAMHQILDQNRTMIELPEFELSSIIRP